ncbi:AAA family ATPase [Desulforegula conservatrix]|uniref:AAA family ATPase n=1 Tax=Desulforegula conservatrix TaxID=153026 RepID=UPI000420A518|nr:MoxR family ATPase [Desulforegula conservatrix]
MNSIFEKIISQVGQVIYGKDEEIKLCLTCLFARGHLLIEDIPGIGKTTLAKTLSRCLGLNFRRIQCTNDMLPGDILGISVFDLQSGSFTFHPGPVFTNILLSDEINRSTPKTQSALLESMEEQQVTVEGYSRTLDKPFFVIATQNPLEQAGTFPLPESQLDRFLMRISIGYPDRKAEMSLLKTGDTSKAADSFEPLMDTERVLRIQGMVDNVFISDALIEYVQDILVFTRRSPSFYTGLSPRAGLSIIRAAKSWAFIHGRDYGLPEDIKKVIIPVAAHRLRASSGYKELSAAELWELLKEVHVP